MLMLESCDNKTPQRVDSPAAEVHNKKKLFKSSADQLNSRKIFAKTTHKRHLFITEQHRSVLLCLSLGEEGDNALLKTLLLNTLTLPTASHQFSGLPFSLCLNSAAQMPKQRHALVAFINCKKTGWVIFAFCLALRKNQLATCTFDLEEKVATSTPKSLSVIYTLMQLCTLISWFDHIWNMMLQKLCNLYLKVGLSWFYILKIFATLDHSTATCTCFKGPVCKM